MQEKQRLTVFLLVSILHFLHIAAHPLDPLTSAEIRRAVSIFKSSTKTSDLVYIYNFIVLQEPPKSLLLPYWRRDATPPDSIYPRKAILYLIENKTDVAVEAVINLGSRRVESNTRIPGVIPSIYPKGMEQFRTPSRDVVKSHPEVRARCAKLGYPDMDLVTTGGASFHFSEKEEHTGKRIEQVGFYGKNFKKDNEFAHPFDFVAVYDWNNHSSLEINDLPIHSDFSTDNAGAKAPRAEGNYDYKLRGGASFLRKDDKPITTSSPKGVSYKVKGNEVSWQKWKFRVGINGREGLVLYTVNYEDEGKRRLILYRASIAEMFVPYGDPRPPYHRKVVFDIGEIGTGFATFPQTLNQDVLGAATFFSAVLHNASGIPVEYKNVASVREEDAGILWKHVDFRTGKGVVTRSHRLVVSTIATFGNYDYGFNWEFYQDGSIQFVAQLTGIVSTNMMSDHGTPAGHGATMSPQVNAQYHQHFFTARLDLDVDGERNSVSTLDIVPIPETGCSSDNPYGQGFTTRQTLLQTVGEGRTKINPVSGRFWVISNPNVEHKMTKKPVAWKLVPSSYPPLLMNPDSPVKSGAGFLDYDVWIEPQNDDHLYPGGVYLNNSGLPEWIGSNPGVSVENSDVMIWHNFGVTHITRTEDWPVMPVETTGFWLKPYNFFKENPGIDVPPPSVAKNI